MYYDLITVGNVSIDLYFWGETLTTQEDRFYLAIGGKYATDGFYESVGGGAANVAIGVAKHRLKTAIFGKMGDKRFGSIIQKQLKTHNIGFELCKRSGKYIKISAILLSHQGERTVINYETPHEHIITSEVQLRRILHTNNIFISNIHSVRLSERVRLLRFIKKNNKNIFINLGIKDCRRPFNEVLPLIALSDYIMVNGYEFAELIKIPVDQIDFSKPITRLRKELAHKTVVITVGKKGSYCYRDGEVIFSPSVSNIRVKDTTGAGDAYTAGFISGVIQGKPIEEAMSIGSNYASVIIQKIGAN